MRQRSRLVISVPDVLELAAVGLACYGVFRLAGLAWALILAAVLFVVGAEFAWDGATVKIPLPLKPQPRVKVKQARQRFAIFRHGLALRHADLVDRFRR